MLERDGTAPTPAPWRAGARCAAAPPSGHPAGSGRSSCGRSGGTPRAAGPPRRPSTRPAGQRRTLASTDAPGDQKPDREEVKCETTWSRGCRRADRTTGPTKVHYVGGGVDDPPPRRTVSSSWCAPAATYGKPPLATHPSHHDCHAFLAGNGAGCTGTASGVIAAGGKPVQPASRKPLGVQMAIQNRHCQLTRSTSRSSSTRSSSTL